MEKKQRNYIQLEDLEVYQLARELSLQGWQIYEKLSWQLKKVIGDQFIESTDSVGANIAEGYGRFHYLDRIKFFYNARGSLLEARHWMNLLKERKLVSEEEFVGYNSIAEKTAAKLQGFINAIYRSKGKFVISSI